MPGRRRAAHKADQYLRKIVAVVVANLERDALAGIEDRAPSIHAIVLQIVDLGHIVALLENVDGAAQAHPTGHPVGGTEAIFLPLPRADAGVGIVRAGQFHIEIDSPAVQRPRPDAEQPGMLIDQNFAGIGHDRSGRPEGKGAVSIVGASVWEKASVQRTVSAVGV